MAKPGSDITPRGRMENSMPLPGFVSTDGGLPHSRFSAPVISGSPSEGTSSGPGPVPTVGGIMTAQAYTAVSTASTNVVLNQVVSTLAARVSAASFVYIPQTTAAIATSSFASADSAPNYTSVGAALIWDAGNSRLGVYSTASGSGTWFFTNTQVTVATSLGTLRNLFTSS